MKGSYQLLLTAALLVLLFFTAAPAKKGEPVELGPRFEEQVFDFGHVGIDFTMFHTFHLINRSEQPYRILKATPSCQCTAVTATDSLVKPGDTVFFRVKFNSKNFYGPTSKSFTVFTDNPKMPEVQFYFLSHVGQWFDGIKPEPISLFFLPKNKSKKVTIKNTSFDEISLTVKEQFDNTFGVALLKDRAPKGQALEFEVTPRSDLTAGTYPSSITLRIEKKGDPDPTILTIPVKIVRY